ncbi:MAG TPA: hypothetical protein VIP09_09520 [Dehalococcoidia bacterium]|jgi:hypothetical protein
MSVYLFPHGANEFDSAKDLANFLRGELTKRRGIYHVVTANKYTSPQADDLVIFCREGTFVGEAWVKKGLRRYPKPKPIKGGVYDGELVFYPETIKVYRKPARFEDVRQTLGLKVNPQAIQRLSPVAYKTIVQSR